MHLTVFPVENITLDRTEMTLRVGESKTITATVTPENATYSGVIWESDDESVAAVENDGTVTAVGAGTATIKATSEENYEIFAFCTVAVSLREFSPVILNSASLTLEGDIGVNFYLIIEDTDIDYVQIRMECNNREVVCKASEAEKSGNRRKFQMKVNAKEMDDTIRIYAEDLKGNKISLKTKSDSATDYQSTGYPYSVAEYLKAAPSLGIEKLTALTRAMDNYGKYSRIYFSHPETVQFENGPDPVNEVTAETLSTYAALSEGTRPEGLERDPEVSLILDSTTSLRIYVKLEEGRQIDNYTFTIDGKEIEAKYNATKEKYYVSVDNIAANKLGESHVITVSGGGNTYTLSNCSALSYAKAVLAMEATEEMPEDKLNKLKDVAKALYLYYDKANVYFTK